MSLAIAEENRQKIIMLLRNARLLPIIENMRLYFKIMKFSKENKAFLERQSNFKNPPYKLMYDAYAYTRYKLYYETGIKHATVISDIIKEYVTSSKITVCEWGCGPARVIQHISKFNDNVKRVIGTDYNKETISWCKEAFKDIDFIYNELNPPLDIGDKSIDVLYCISVFTHLSEEQHYKWINEIKRVLKPGGLFISTFHGDEYKNKLLPDELNKYEKGELVTRSRVKEGSRLYSSFQNDAFIRNKLLNGFKNVQKIESNLIRQSVWIGIVP